MFSPGRMEPEPIAVFLLQRHIDLLKHVLEFSFPFFGFSVSHKENDDPEKRTKLKPDVIVCDISKT